MAKIVRISWTLHTAKLIIIFVFRRFAKPALSRYHAPWSETAVMQANSDTLMEREDRITSSARKEKVT